jgi:hypothetical protein
MREPKINLAIISYWDNFDEVRYNNYLKVLKNVDNTLSRIHGRSLEDIKKDCASRLRMGGTKDEQPLGETNH